MGVAHSIRDRQESPVGASLLAKALVLQRSHQSLRNKIDKGFQLGQ
jgi:hypothetical protein